MAWTRIFTGGAPVRPLAERRRAAWVGLAMSVFSFFAFSWVMELLPGGAFRAGSPLSFQVLFFPAMALQSALTLRALSLEERIGPPAWAKFVPFTPVVCLLILLAPMGASWVGLPWLLPLSASRHVLSVEGPAVQLRDGRILFVGESSLRSQLYAQLFDPATARFSTPSQPAQGRTFCSVALLSDGRAIVVGGLGGYAIEAYDPGSDRWETLARIEDHVSNAALAPLPGRRLLIVRHMWGREGVLLLDAERKTLRPVGLPAMVPAGSPQATVLKDGTVLVTGPGYGTKPGASNAYLWDDRTETMVSLPRMRFDRQAHEATLLQDGRVLVTGGTSATEREAELFDPATRTWRDAGLSLRPRSHHSATLLSDGRVLLLGGNPTEKGIRSDAELFDPASGRFMPVPVPDVWFSWPQQHTVLDRNRVLVFKKDLLPAAYEPGTGAWHPALQGWRLGLLRSTSGLLP